MSNTKKVYSTEFGRLCGNCEKPLSDCLCKKADQSEIKGSGKVRIHLESKKRRGKVVTVISGIKATETELHSIAKDLKRKLGVGGSIKEGTIEIQGDHREFILKHLLSVGMSAKISGG